MISSLKNFANRRSKNKNEEGRLQGSNLLCRETTWDFYQHLMVLYEKGDDVIRMIEDHQVDIELVRQQVEADVTLSDELKTHYRRELGILKFNDLLYHCWWASRILMFDENGQKTHIDEKLMERAESMMPDLNLAQNDDHILHSRLLHVFCQLKIKFPVLDLHNTKIVGEIDRLFNYAKKLRESCSEEMPCVIVGLFFDEYYANILKQMNRKDDSDDLIAKIDELLQSRPLLLENKLIQTKWIQSNLLKVIQYSSQNNFLAVDRHAHEMLKYSKKAFDGKPNPHTCRAYLYLGYNLLTSSDNLSQKEVEKVGKYFTKARNDWDELARTADANRRHYRRMSLLSAYNYYLFKTGKEETNSAAAVSEIYERVFKTVRLSPEMDNLDLFEINLKLACEQRNFKKAMKLYKDYSLNRKPSTLPFSYGPIMKAVKLICLAELSSSSPVQPSDFFVQKDPSLSKLTESLMRLKKCSNARAAYWFRLGCATYYKQLEARGRIDEFKKFRDDSEHWLQLREDHIWSQCAGSNKSSMTSIQEVCTIDISQLNFMFIQYVDINNDDDLMAAIEDKLSNSVDNLKSSLEQVGGLTLIDGENFVSDKLAINLKRHILRPESRSKFKEFNFVVINQYVDRSSDYVSADELVKWVESIDNSNFTLLIINSILVSDPSPINFIHRFRRSNTKPPSGENLIVKSCNRVERQGLEQLLHEDSVLDVFKDVLVCSRGQPTIDLNELVEQVGASSSNSTNNTAVISTNKKHVVLKLVDS